MEKGLILGLEHEYLRDGVWVRCACGSEILECVKVHHEEKGIEYQIRCFGLPPEDAEEDWYYRCFVPTKEQIQAIADHLRHRKQGYYEVPVFKNDADRTLPTDYCFVVEEYADNDFSIRIMYRGNKTKRCVWEVILHEDVPTALAAKLESMIEGDK